MDVVGFDFMLVPSHLGSRCSVLGTQDSERVKKLICPFSGRSFWSNRPEIIDPERSKEVDFYRLQAKRGFLQLIHKLLVLSKADRYHSSGNRLFLPQVQP